MESLKKIPQSWTLLKQTLEMGKVYLEKAAQKLDGGIGSQGVTHVERNPMTTYQKMTKIESDMINVRSDMDSAAENLGPLTYFPETVDQKSTSITHLIKLHLVKFTVQLLSAEMFKRWAVNSTTKEQAENFVKTQIKSAKRKIGAQLSSCEMQSETTTQL